MGSYWSCAQTGPRREPLALRNLKRQNFHAFYPLFLARDKRGRQAIVPVFPSYVFIELNDETGQNWSPINSTLGVTRLLTRAGGDEIHPCRIEFAEALHRMRIRDNSAEPDLLPVNTRVKIRRGPFAERVALVEMSRHDRVRLILEVFNREIMVEFEIDAVVRV
jgi:transcription antitermination factor NusG